MTTPATEAATAWPRRPARLAEIVLQDLVSRLAAGEFPAGSLLPAEPLLCAHYSVSRTTIREAVILLQEKGLVSVQQGVGTTVTEPEAWSLLDPMVMEQVVAHQTSSRYLDDLVRLQIGLEADMTAAAAQRATSAAVVAPMHLAIARMDTTTDAAAFFQADLALHDLIMTLSGNALARSIVMTIHAHAWPGLRRATSLSQLAEANAEHHRIVAAIGHGDGAVASEEMRQHLSCAWAAGKESR